MIMIPPNRAIISVTTAADAPTYWTKAVVAMPSVTKTKVNPKTKAKPCVQKTAVNCEIRIVGDKRNELGNIE